MHSEADRLVHTDEEHEEMEKELRRLNGRRKNKIPQAVLERWRCRRLARYRRRQEKHRAYVEKRGKL